jgi:hypothetical protein
LPIGFAACLEAYYNRTPGKPQPFGDAPAGRLDRRFEQHAAALRRLPLQALRKTGAGADRIGQALARQHEGAAPLFGPEHAILHQCGDGAAHRMAVDAIALGQCNFRW